MKLTYDNIEFDSVLEIMFYQKLVDDKVRFIYQDEYKNHPIHINIGRRKTYKPDFIVFDDENKKIYIIEMKGWSKWSGNEDNNIMDFMNNAVKCNQNFIKEWLFEAGIDVKDYDICYRRFKYLKKYGFVDYNFKSPNTISNMRKEKIDSLSKELKVLSSELKDVKRYFSYLKKHKLSSNQRKWIDFFEKKYDITGISSKIHIK